MYNPRAFKRLFTAPHIICLAHKLNTSVSKIFSFLLSLYIYWNYLLLSANRRIQFFLLLYDKNRLHSNFLSSNERFIFFNSNLVNGPEFRAHYLNICTFLLRPQCLRWHYERASLTSSNWRKPFFTQFEYMFNRNIDQDLVNRLLITNCLARFLKARQLCYLLPNRTATQRQHQDCRFPSFNKLKIQSKYLIACWQGACRTVQHLCLWPENAHERQLCEEFAPQPGGRMTMMPMSVNRSV